MAWYELTTEQKAQRFHWNDVPTAEQDELKRFASDFMRDLPLAVSALGGHDIGGFYEGVVGGLLANGKATLFSDFDLLILRDARPPIYAPGEPEILRNVVAYLGQYMQRGYSLSRRVNVVCTPLSILYDKPGAVDAFGYSLTDNQLYQTAAEAKTRFEPGE